MPLAWKVICLKVEAQGFGAPDPDRPQATKNGWPHLQGSQEATVDAPMPANLLVKKKLYEKKPTCATAGAGALVAASAMVREGMVQKPAKCPTCGSRALGDLELRLRAKAHVAWRCQHHDCKRFVNVLHCSTAGEGAWLRQKALGDALQTPRAGRVTARPSPGGRDKVGRSGGSAKSINLLPFFLLGIAPLSVLLHMGLR